MPQSDSARWPPLLSLCSRAGEPQLRSPRAATLEAQCPQACAPQQKKPLQQEACAMQSSPCSLQLEKHPSSKDPAQPKTKCSFLSRVQLLASWTVACQAPLSMEFSRQEYWSGLPFPSLEDLPHPGIEPVSLASPTLRVYSLPLSHQGKEINLKTC